MRLWFIWVVICYHYKISPHCLYLATEDFCKWEAWMSSLHPTSLTLPCLLGSQDLPGLASFSFTPVHGTSIFLVSPDCLCRLYKLTEFRIAPPIDPDTRCVTIILAQETESCPRTFSNPWLSWFLPGPFCVSSLGKRARSVLLVHPGPSFSGHF